MVKRFFILFGMTGRKYTFIYCLNENTFFKNLKSKILLFRNKKSLSICFIRVFYPFINFIISSY